MEVRRDNPKGIEILLNKALGLANYESKVGWFENAKEETNGLHCGDTGVWLPVKEHPPAPRVS